MTLASPLWLLFLIPWAALVAWLLAGDRHRVAVPFLELWGGPVAGQKIKRTIHPPPRALACVLIALLLAILGAASPVLHGHHAKSDITLIVDRGVTMAAQSRIHQIAQSIPAMSFAQVVLVPPWSGLANDGSNWPDAPASAINTADLLRAAVSQQLTESNSPAVVLSDQNLPAENPRLIQIGPASIPQNVDIVSLAASASPKPQMMVRLRNQSSLKSAELVITTNAQSTSRSIDLPATDSEQNYFFDLAALGDTLEAKLNVSDDLPIDNLAWLVRQRSWPKLEARSSLPPELRRMIEVYQSHRPPSDDSRRVEMVDDLNALPKDTPGVVFIRQGENVQPLASAANVQVIDHPVSAHVDWRTIARDASISDLPAGGWTPIVRSGSSTLLAIREQPVRQVWVGFNSATFPATKDFVIFWTNVFDWLGQGGDEFTSEAVHSIGEDWKIQTPPVAGFDLSPGIYRRGEGAPRAMNAINVRFSSPVQRDWNSRLKKISTTSAGGLETRPILLLFTLALLLAGATLWKPLAA